jgi:hypothetical protein
MANQFNPYLQSFFDGTIAPMFDLEQILCIDYKPYYNLSKGSIGQIIVAISLITMKKKKKMNMRKFLIVGLKLRYHFLLIDILNYLIIIKLRQIMRLNGII